MKSSSRLVASLMSFSAFFWAYSVLADYTECVNGYEHHVCLGPVIYHFSDGGERDGQMDFYNGKNEWRGSSIEKRANGDVIYCDKVTPVGLCDDRAVVRRPDGSSYETMYINGNEVPGAPSQIDRSIAASKNTGASHAEALKSQPLGVEASSTIGQTRAAPSGADTQTETSSEEAGEEARAERAQERAAEQARAQRELQAYAMNHCESEQQNCEQSCDNRASMSASAAVGLMMGLTRMKGMSPSDVSSAQASASQNSETYCKPQCRQQYRLCVANIQ